MTSVAYSTCQPYVHEAEIRIQEVEIQTQAWTHAGDQPGTVLAAGHPEGVGAFNH